MSTPTAVERACSPISCPKRTGSVFYRHAKNLQFSKAEFPRSRAPAPELPGSPAIQKRSNRTSYKARGAALSTDLIKFRGSCSKGRSGATAARTQTVDCDCRISSEVPGRGDGHDKIGVLIAKPAGICADRKPELCSMSDFPDSNKAQPFQSRRKAI
jgi:hypothetical protein